ncbi:MAG: hypothetical protein KC708_26500 [Anaerolineae bacterium]|nr:hypothetical protein [Anaerolineae bacterium]
MNDLYEAPFDDAVTLRAPRKRKRGDKPSRTIFLGLIVSLVIILAGLAVLLFAKPTSMGSADSPTAYMNTNRLPDYSFDEATIAQENDDFLAQYPEMSTWHRHQSLDVSLWLPPRYALYGLDVGVEIALAGLEAHGDMDAFIDAIRIRPDVYRLIAVAGAGSVVVTRERPLISMPFEQYLTFLQSIMPDSMSMAYYDMIELQGNPAVRYVVHYSAAGHQMTAITYIVPDGQNVFGVTFSGFSSLLDETDLVETDLIMQTFRVSHDDE